MRPVTTFKLHESNFHIEGDHRCACEKCVNRFGHEKVHIKAPVLIGVDWGSSPPDPTWKPPGKEMYYGLKRVRFKDGRKDANVYMLRGDDQEPFMAWEIGEKLELPLEMIGWLYN